MNSLKLSPDDAHRSPTSLQQHETEENMMAVLPKDLSTGPVLSRNSHFNFLSRLLFKGFPSRYAVMDASQGWFMFWIFQAFSMLGAEFDPINKRKAINNILAAQHPDGGFGGGPHQTPHILPTYASVCALAIVGRPGPGGGWDEINRKGMYNFFLSLKQPDGSFRVASDAEVDIRGTYCALAVATLLDILTPTLAANIPEFIQSCQTYEGGFSSSSQPYYTSNGNLASTPRPPVGEAHGGYTACAVGSWFLLEPVKGKGQKNIDMRGVLRWLSKLQGGGRDLGGFRGRTNKLVDGCYAWWVGSCFALLESLGYGDQSNLKEVEDENGDWVDAEDIVYDSWALQQYILYAAQDPNGGLRDKPFKSPDAYHTLYVLAGLSNAQHHVRPSRLKKTWIPHFDDLLDLDPSESKQERNSRRQRIFMTAYHWKEYEERSRVLGGKVNRVNATHPLFNLTITHSQAMLSHFYGQT